jgi:hypothetical protein
MCCCTVCCSLCAAALCAATLSAATLCAAALWVAQVDEAHRKLDKSSAIGAQLIAAAETKQRENRLEFERCAIARSVALGLERAPLLPPLTNPRWLGLSCSLSPSSVRFPPDRSAERIKAFVASDEVATTLHPLYAASSTSSKNDKSGGGYTNAPRRTDFLSLHLTLLREGYLDASAVGAHTSSFPYCYAAPPFIRSEYVKKEFKCEEGAERGAEAGGGDAQLPILAEQYRCTGSNPWHRPFIRPFTSSWVQYPCTVARTRMDSRMWV